jgi:threonine dehydrogenase-like Zn-dependent dehydrogenase
MYGRSNLTRDVDIAASILALRPELGAAVITHRFPLDAATEAFATARDRAAGAIKVVLEV